MAPHSFSHTLLPALPKLRGVFKLLIQPFHFRQQLFGFRFHQRDIGP